MKWVGEEKLVCLGLPRSRELLGAPFNQTNWIHGLIHSNWIHLISSISIPQLHSSSIVWFHYLFFRFHFFIPSSLSSLFSLCCGALAASPPITHNNSRRRKREMNSSIPAQFIHPSNSSLALGCLIGLNDLDWLGCSPREVFSFQRNSINFINLISFPFNTFPWGPLPVNKGNSISPSILKEWAAMNFSFVEWAGPLIN